MKHLLFTILFTSSFSLPLKADVTLEEVNQKLDQILTIVQTNPTINPNRRYECAAECMYGNESNSTVAGSGASFSEAYEQMYSICRQRWSEHRGIRFEQIHVGIFRSSNSYSNHREAVSPTHSCIVHN